MKKLLTLFIFLITNSLFACVCKSSSLLDLTAKADFIATAKILSVNKDTENEDIHNIQIEILELLKGSKISWLKLYSRLNSSCGFYTPKNTNWLIFAYKEKDGKLSFGYCSGTETMDEKFRSELYSKKYSKADLDKLNANHLNRINSKIQVLEYLKERKIKPNNEFDLNIYFIDDCIKNIRGFEEKTKRFSLFELRINKDLSIENISVLREFNNKELAMNLIDCTKNKIHVYKSGNDKSIPNETKIIVGFYYYPAKGKRTSFISNLSR